VSSARVGKDPCATHKRADVGFEGLSGNRMLDQSITGFDPEQTWRNSRVNAWR
jgi:hypothetical protein